MQQNRDKAALIMDLNAAQHERSIEHILKLLDILISEVRVENDYAEGNSLYRNQGEIAGYMKLKEYIQRGLPAGK
jgi:hypothetical protein